MDIKIDDIKLIIRMLAVEYNKASREWYQSLQTSDYLDMDSHLLSKGVMCQAAKTLGDFQELGVAGVRIDQKMVYTLGQGKNGELKEICFNMVEVTFDDEQ